MTLISLTRLGNVKTEFLDQEFTASLTEQSVTQVLIIKNVQCKIVNVFLPINFLQKNHLIETALLSTHNICFGLEIRKLFFCYARLTKGMLL